MHTTRTMNCIGVGPWYVCRKLTACMTDGKTHLAITGHGWVTRTGPVAPWSGRHAEAVRLAATHGGDPVPTKWVDIRHLRRDWRQKETINAKQETTP